MCFFLRRMCPCGRTGACIVTGSILFCIIGRKTIDPSLAGLAIGVWAVARAVLVASLDRFALVHLHDLNVVCLLLCICFCARCVWVPPPPTRMRFGAMLAANALSVTQTLNWMVRQSAEVESKIVSVERLREYSFLPVEPHAAASVTVPSTWPSQGAISIRNLKLKYRAECVLVALAVCFARLRSPVGS